MRKRKLNLLLIIFVIVLILGLGYAYLTTTLSINGTTDVDSNTWNIYWDNVQVKEGSVTATTPTIDTNKTSVSFNVHLSKPGDFYEFTVDAKNDGTIDAMIETISSTINNSTTIPNYLIYKVSYLDGIEIENNQLLKTNTTETYKVRVEYRTDINPNQLPNSSESLTLSFEVTYIQANNSAIEVPHLVSLDLGDYFTLVPDSSSYTVDSSMTGYTESEQIIHPNELTLWRVIIKNNDGSLDAISEYTSSDKVTFKGSTGYRYFVSCLQTIAAQYSKQNYTIDTRMVGYDGQTLVVDGNFYSNPPYTISTPTPTTGVGVEYGGGLYGDTLYLKDYIAVNELYGTMKANKIGTEESNRYWIASRSYKYVGNIDYFYCLRAIAYNNDINSSQIYFMSNGWLSSSNGYSVRPIITIRPNINAINGKGTLDNPYILE